VPAATPAATRGPQSAAVASETLSDARDTPAGLILPGRFFGLCQRLLFRLPISAGRERRLG